MRYTHITQCVTGNAYGLGITPRLGADRLENEANNESTGRCVTSTTTMADVKALAPFLQRADEMSRADPKVAYYCRMYAVEEGMKAKERSAELNALMGELLKQLESTKAGAALAETREEDELYLENFAMKLFAKADKADRANKRDAKTAKMFYVSGVFIEILNQFGPLNEDMGEKQRYAAWRGAELSGAAWKARRHRRRRTTRRAPSPRRRGRAAAMHPTGVVKNHRHRGRAMPTSSGRNRRRRSRPRGCRPRRTTPSPHHPRRPCPLTPQTAIHPRLQTSYTETLPRVFRLRITTPITSAYPPSRMRRCTPSSRCPRWRTRTCTPRLKTSEKHWRC